MATATLDTLIADAPMFAPGEVERSTGRFRCPEKFLDWDVRTQEAILAGQEPMVGPVVIVLIVVGFNSAVIGPFESPAAARGWWDAPFGSRLRERVQMVLRPAPATKGGEA